MTEADRKRLTVKAAELEAKAVQVGSMSGLWETIFTIRAMLSDGNYWPYKSEEEALKEILGCLTRS